MKKTFALILCIVFMMSLAACGDAVNDVTSDAESIGDSVINGAENAADKVTSGAENAADKTESAVKDTEDNSMNLMAGITANDAKEAALKHAGLDESQVRDVDIDLDRDNGTLIYEVDFNFGDTEYDYDINAETGEIISANKSKD